MEESHEQLSSTVGVFEDIIQSSETVIQVTAGLKKEVTTIFEVKDKLKVSMDKVESMSKQVAGSTAEISGSSVEQVSGIDDILKAMESVQNGMDELAAILNEKSNTEQ